MKAERTVVDALAALAQAHRLAAYRALVQAGPAGLAAGILAEAVGLAPSALSFHLAHLSRAGLITCRRDGRRLIYAADFAAMKALVGYLTENCCGGNPLRCRRTPKAGRMKRMHVHVGVDDLAEIDPLLQCAVRRRADGHRARLCQVDARRSTPQLRDLGGPRRARDRTSRHPGRGRRRTRRGLPPVAGRRPPGSRRGRDDLLLRQVDQKLDRRPAGRDVGNLSHRRRRDDLWHRRAAREPRCGIGHCCAPALAPA